VTKIAYLNVYEQVLRQRPNGSLFNFQQKICLEVINCKHYLGTKRLIFGHFRLEAETPSLSKRRQRKSKCKTKLE